MIPNDEPLRSQTIKRMIDFVGKRDDLTKWESDFVDSLSEQFVEGRKLSQKQCEILERLYDK